MTVKDEIRTAEGIARFGGKSDRYFVFLKKFAEGLPELPAFADATADANKAATDSTVHGIKGTAGNLGAVSIYDAAVAFEKTMRAGTPDESLYLAFQEALQATKEKILTTDWA